MDYIFKAIGIAFLVSVVLFIYNALKIQHGSNHFPTPKDYSKNKENEIRIERGKDGKKTYEANFVDGSEK